MTTNKMRWLLFFSLLLNVFVLGLIFSSHNQNANIIIRDIEQFIDNHQQIMLEMNSILYLSSVYTEDGELNYSFVSHLRNLDNHLMTNEEIYHKRIAPYVPHKLKLLNDEGILLVNDIWIHSINGEYEKVNERIKEYSNTELELNEKIEKNGVFRKKPINKSPMEVKKILEQLLTE